MKIVFFEAQNWQEEPFQTALPHDQVVFTPDKLTVENVDQYPDAEIISVFINSRVDAAVLQKLPHLKLIATRSTGFDHIDLPTATAQGIVVSNVPDYGQNTVAEHTFALILALSRKIFQTYERTESLDFTVDESIQGFDLMGKTIGIYGLGSIGYYVAKIAHGFGMKILAYKRTPDPKLTERFGVKFVNGIEEILQQSDVITLHCPLVKETEHLINKENINLIKPGAILINTARGGLIDTDALIEALESSRLSGAGLDVFEGENALTDPVALLDNQASQEHNLRQVLENHILVARDDVILTPHNAFNSREAVRRILDETIANITQFAAGQPQNQVSEN